VITRIRINDTFIKPEPLPLKVTFFFFLIPRRDRTKEMILKEEGERNVV
jgi:hypothetical protein